MAMSDNLRGALYMNAAMAAFTVNDACMKLVTQSLPLFQAIGLRGVVSAAFLLVLAASTGALRLGIARGSRGLLLARTLAEVAATLLFLLALRQMPLANLSAVLQVVPLAVTLGAALVFHEPIGWRRLTAILIGFGGVMLIIRPGTEGFDIWSVVGIGSVVFVVARDLLTRRFQPGTPSVLIALAASAGVALMGFAGVATTGWQAMTAEQMLLVAFSGVTLVAGYILSVMVMRVGEIGFVAPFRYSGLIWAIVLGWTMFGTLPDGMTLAGTGIVIATGLFTLLRERKLTQARAVA